MPDVQGPGGVGRYKLNHDLLTTTVVAFAKVIGCSKHCVDDLRFRRCGEPDIDESWTSDFGWARQQCRHRQRSDNRDRNIARFRTQFPGKLQCAINGKVTVIRILWLLNLDNERQNLIFKRWIGGEKSFLKQCGNGGFVID